MLLRHAAFRSSLQRVVAGLRCPASLGVDHDGDFAFDLDGDGEVGGFVVVEVAGGDGEAALEIDGVVNWNGRSEVALAVAVEQVGVVDTGGAGSVQVAVEIEIGDHAGFGSDAVLAGGWVDCGLAKSAIPIIQQDDHSYRAIGQDQVLFTVVTEVGDLDVHDFAPGGAVGPRL